LTGKDYQEAYVDFPETHILGIDKYESFRSEKETLQAGKQLL